MVKEKPQDVEDFLFRASFEGPLNRWQAGQSYALAVPRDLTHRAIGDACHESAPIDNRLASLSERLYLPHWIELTELHGASAIRRDQFRRFDVSYEKNWS
jgi:hypothetical protein